MFLLIIIYAFFLFGLEFILPIVAYVQILNSKRSDSKYAIGLKRFIIFSILHLTLTFYMISNDIYLDGILCLLCGHITPIALIAWYFGHYAYWEKKYKNIADFDTMQALKDKEMDNMLIDTYINKQSFINL